MQLQYLRRMFVQLKHQHLLLRQNLVFLQKKHNCPFPYLLELLPNRCVIKNANFNARSASKILIKNRRRKSVDKPSECLYPGSPNAQRRLSPLSNIITLVNKPLVIEICSAQQSMTVCNLNGNCLI